jgi:DNA helicase-2/ATP-dependent DNA helicase PcrA
VAVGGSLFASGDDDQSIYAFRGAEVGNMRDFEREFRVDNVIRLEQNYRSHGNILDAANAIIKHNKARLGKNLWTDAGSGEPIRVYEAFNDTEEARWIVEEIRSLAAEGLARREMALLYRSMPSRACSSTPCSPPACPTASMAACASSSVRKSSTRSPTCA